MPRRRFEDDDRGDYPDRPRSSGNGLLIGLLAGGGLLVVIVCGGGLTALFMARTAAREERVAIAAREEAIRAETLADYQKALAKGAAGRGAAGEVLDGKNGNPIVNEFSDNAIAAEGKWIGKRVQFWNSVGKFDRDEDGWYVPFQHCDITVHIAAGETNNFSKIQPGTVVEVEAVLT